MTQQGKYVGPLHHLRGFGAILRVAPGGGWLAQFDVPNTFLNPSILFPYQDWQKDALGFGWHAFAEDDFEPTTGA